MEVRVQFPAAWFLLPLDEPVVADPDLVDNPSRYEGAPEGGWEPVGETVLQIFVNLQTSISNPLTPEIVVRPPGLDHLSFDQQLIVYTWFTSDQPAIRPGDQYWIDGRHRSWGLKTAGFRNMPVLLLPFDTAIAAWHPASANGWPFDQTDLAVQLEALENWRSSDETRTWRKVNPEVEMRWTQVLQQWDRRLARGM